MAPIPEEFEEYRDHRWRREGTRQVETALAAERFVEDVGFAFCMTDSRRPGPSLYIAVCGRRDAVMPRHVQKDPEASHTWVLKDDLLRRGKVYYGKLARGKAMFLAPRMIPYFHAVLGVPRADENRRLSRHARAILGVLRKEWEMSTSDLRQESGVKDRASFNRALDELQAAMIVMPSAVFYQPAFTYIWTRASDVFPSSCAAGSHAASLCAKSPAAFSRRRASRAAASWRASPGCRGPMRDAATGRWSRKAMRRRRRPARIGWPTFL